MRCIDRLPGRLAHGRVPQQADPVWAGEYGRALERVNAVSDAKLVLERRGVCLPRWRPKRTSRVASASR